MEKVLFCQYCDSEVDVNYKTEQITSIINGENVSIEFNVPYCVKCGKELSNLDIEDERYDLLYKKYRQMKKLLLPEEIKDIREKYGLSQRAFSRVLGFAESTINRYELGAIQDNTNNTLIKLSNNPDFMMELLNQNRENLNINEQNKLENRINELLNKQSIDCVSIEEKLNFLINKTNKYDKKLDSIDKKIEVMSKKIANSTIENKKNDTEDYLENFNRPLRTKINQDWGSFVN